MLNSFKKIPILSTAIITASIMTGCGGGDSSTPSSNPNSDVITLKKLSEVDDGRQLPITVYAESDVDDENLKHVANIIANYLDNNENGQWNDKLSGQLIDKRATLLLLSDNKHRDEVIEQLKNKDNTFNNIINEGNLKTLSITNMDLCKGFESYNECFALKRMSAQRALEKYGELAVGRFDEEGRFVSPYYPIEGVVDGNGHKHEPIYPVGDDGELIEPEYPTDEDGDVVDEGGYKLKRITPLDKNGDQLPPIYYKVVAPGQLLRPINVLDEDMFLEPRTYDESYETIFRMIADIGLKDNPDYYGTNSMAYHEIGFYQGYETCNYDQKSPEKHHCNNLVPREDKESVSEYLERERGQFENLLSSDSFMLQPNQGFQSGHEERLFSMSKLHYFIIAAEQLGMTDVYYHMERDFHHVARDLCTKDENSYEMNIFCNAYTEKKNGRLAFNEKKLWLEMKQIPNKFSEIMLNNLEAYAHMGLMENKNREEAQEKIEELGIVNINRIPFGSYKPLETEVNWQIGTEEF
ncbi:hypothetical protein [Vibrio caribbeanicus]|uniref:hypothetical protein n=1 Tax=Vibrio caribbeanicus TaxID=701175 RepID=UPI0030DCFAE3